LVVEFEADSMAVVDKILLLELNLGSSRYLQSNVRMRREGGIAVVVVDLATKAL